jgi:hypothetical protein
MNRDTGSILPFHPWNSGAMPTAADDLATTRLALHMLAEHILCAARYAAVGRIGLEIVPGGFATPPFGDTGRVVAVVDRELVVRDDGEVQRAPIETLRAAGKLVGVEPGGPSELFPRATPLDLDAPLVLDPPAYDALVGWYERAAAALHRFGAEVSADRPSGITLWPEHFDVALRAGNVNYGASPGDDKIDEPYAYVGPDAVPAADGFWNQPFGAARTWAELSTAEDVVGFFGQGRAALGR